MNKEQSGRLGGIATVNRHGSMHMEAIGRAGFWATVERYHGGDAAAYMQLLRERAAQVKTAQFDPRARCQVVRV